MRTEAVSQETLLERWTTGTVEDTRTPGPPTSRRYASAFRDVWRGLREAVEIRPRWTVTHADESAGQLTVLCRTRLFGFRDDLVVWVWLDEDGLTRVDARSRSRVGRTDLGANRRRIDGLLEDLDRRLERL